MSTFARLRLRQPPTRKKVIELAVAGPVGRWFARRRWAAFTLPLPFVVVIFYWNTPAPNPYTRVHEFVHVEQDQATPFFLNQASIWFHASLASSARWLVNVTPLGLTISRWIRLWTGSLTKLLPANSGPNRSSR